SETRISDFMRLVQALERLPAVKEALPEIGYTKAREIVQDASPRTEATWVEEARTSTRAQLVQKVKRVKARAAAKPAAAPLFAPLADEPVLAAEVPVRVSVEFTPEQHARWEALWEQVRKRGATGDRAEVLLEALQALNTTQSETTNNVENFPRGKPDPSIQIHVHQCPDCGQVEANGRPLGRADAERVQCDAVIDRPGKRATPTIPPHIRREVLARDRHRCQGPGCGRTRFLEVHHKRPRARGGTHEPANLVTLCGSCHRLWHERR
ncbi:MAG: HNH endonuclease, partial [Candidatus Krumholzibacteriia bacterium]